MHDRGHLYANPGERGAGRLSAAALQDVRDCSASAGVVIPASFDLAPYQGRTMSELRDALAAAGVIPPVHFDPVGDTVNAVLAGAGDLLAHGAILAGAVVLILLGAWVLFRD